MMTKHKAQLVGFDAGAIPKELKANKRWAPWQAVWREKKGKYDKVPRQAARPEFGISTAKPERWYSYETALAAYEANKHVLDGIGYCMTGPHGVVGIDLDGCVSESGKVADWALAVVQAVGSYTEISPSGRGLRILVYGQTPCDWTNHDIGVEVYGGHEARFLTVTGKHLAGSPTEVRQAPEGVLAELQEKYAREKHTAEVIDFEIPDVLDEMFLPDVESLPLDEKPGRFLRLGEYQDDRSGALHAAGVALYSLGLDDETVFSILAQNRFAMEVALDHRRQDQDRALRYLWREHCVKAKPKASTVAVADEFPMVELPKDAPAPLPAFKRDGKGRIEATVENLLAALRRPDFCGMQIAYDAFRDEIVFALEGREGQWQRFTDVHYTRLRAQLERRGFKPVGRELIRDTVLEVADANGMDTAIEWLEGLEWDGIERIDTFFPTYFSAADTEYTRAVSAYLWTALAGRVMQPGCKADMVPILVGPQGAGKSTGVAALVPSSDFFCEVSFSEKDDDLSRRMRGRLVAEIGELRGLHTKELEFIKAFITRTHEDWVPKYREFATKFPRRLVFVGTTNKNEFLADETGNRRWLPMDVGSVDVEGIERDRLQLWAEARERFALFGVEFQQAERLAQGEHDNYVMVDPWVEAVRDWLKEPDALTGEAPGQSEFLRTNDVASGALNLDAKNTTRMHQMRIAAVLRELGYSRRRVRVGETRIWAFVPTLSLPEIER